MKQEQKQLQRMNYNIPRYDLGYQSMHFNLKQQKEQMKLTQIMLAVKIGGQRYRVYTRLKVEPAFWDTENGCCVCNDLLSKRVKARMEDLNLTMSKMKNELEIADMRAAEQGRLLTIDDLRSIVIACISNDNNRTAPKAVCRKTSTAPLDILRSIADSFESQISNKGEKGASSSRKTYLYCCRRLEEFLSESRIELNSFDKLDKQFYNKFSQWLNNKRFYSGGKWIQYTASTVQSTLSAIGNLHHKAYEAGYCDSLENRGMAYRFAKSSQGGKIYLSETELEKIINLTQLKKKEAEIRDMFYISAFTGLRISDINRLNSAVIDDGTIRLFQKKTHGCVTVPILKEVSGIIEKYLSRPDGFPTIEPSLANRAIKTICMKAGIDSLTPVNEYRGGEVQVHNSPKYELVSFHTARRSCITNLYRRGYSPNYLMVMSGHKSISSFQRYIRTNNEELAEDFIKELKRKKAI